MITYTNLNQKQKPFGIQVFEFILTIICNALVLLMAAGLFKGVEVSSFGYAILTAAVIVFLNKTIKPLISIMTLPLTVFTLGLFYPFVNVMILKLAGLIMGDGFIVEGWLVPFFVAIFISIMTIVLDLLITKKIIGGMKR